MLDAVDYAVDNGADIVTMSWGSDEDQSEIDDDSHFSKSGVIFLASAGDDGADAIWPATSPNVISVGGTSLSLDDNGNRLSETGWSQSGGGKSLYESAPSWQDNFGASSDMRVTPDVSAIADPDSGVSVYCGTAVQRQSGWFVMGGTSLSAPVWAGIVACLNQNSSYIGNVAALYTLAGGTGYTNADNFFYDITSGSNGYAATVGFDQVTGLGTPRCGGNPVVKTDVSGVSYSAHVQKIGWQNAVKNGALAGTTGKALRVEALKIKLLGSSTAGTAITYQAYVQKKGWMAAVSNGATAGTTGLGLRVEALRMTLSGLNGYSVRYRVHVQKKGWMDWKTAANGKALSATPIAGTMGQSLRVEAVEITIVKTGSQTPVS
jgi:Predicted protease